MNKEELQQKIAEYYIKLPQKAQEVFSGMRWLGTLKEISVKFGLDDKQTETIGTETILVLLGIIHSDEYENNLRNQINISKELMDEILKEIDNSVLRTIKQELNETFLKNSQELEEEQKYVEDQSDDDWIKNIKFIVSNK